MTRLDFPGRALHHLQKIAGEKFPLSHVLHEEASSTDSNTICPVCLIDQFL